MMQDIAAKRSGHSRFSPDGEAAIMTYRDDERAAWTAAGPSHFYSANRYADQPMDWRTRIAGAGSTAGVLLTIVAASLVTWQVVQPQAVPPTLNVVNLNQDVAPPEPVREVPEGPEQVEQKEQKPKEQQKPDPVPNIVVPQLSTITRPVPPPVAQAAPTDAVPDTSAPKSIPAPPANRASSNAEVTWQSKVLAHLEKHRRYPAAARSARRQGVAHVRFTMNRNGMVLSSSILRSSGFAILDRAALDTLRRAQPLPAIPEDRPDTLELTVPVEFFVG